MRRAVAIVILALAAAAPSAAGPGPTFVDSSNDAGAGPDVTRVDASSGATKVTFSIRSASASSWQDAAAILAIDNDAASGVELTYVLHSLHDQFTLDRSNGTHVARPAATWNLNGAVLTIQVPFSELGSHAPIAFTVGTPAPNGGDSAPDNGTWSFAPDARVRSISATFTPAAPVHGRPFALASARTSFSDGTTGSAAASCNARLAGKALRGGCNVRIPATAKGKLLQLTVTAAGVKRVYLLRVR